MLCIWLVCSQTCRVSWRCVLQSFLQPTICSHSWCELCCIPKHTQCRRTIVTIIACNCRNGLRHAKFGVFCHTVVHTNARVWAIVCDIRTGPRNHRLNFIAAKTTIAMPHGNDFAQWCNIPPNSRKTIWVDLVGYVADTHCI